MSAPLGDQSIMLANMSLDLISPAEAPKSMQNSIFSLDPAETKLSQPNTFANCTPAVPIPLAPA